MSARFENLVGQKFGSLSVLEFSHRDASGIIHWKCRCDCGNITTPAGRNMKRGISTSCGCSRKKIDITRFNDIVGMKFGLLTAQKFAFIKGHNPYYECLCECGNTTTIPKYNLLKAKSCGCLQRKENTYKLFDGVGEITKTIFNKIVANAVNRDKEFLITPEYAWNLFLKQDRKCAISGLPIEFNKNSRDRSGTASLDRIDSSLGYIIGNVQWTHKDINNMKNDLPEKEFLYYCETVYLYSKSKIVIK